MRAVPKGHITGAGSSAPCPWNCPLSWGGIGGHLEGIKSDGGETADLSFLLSSPLLFPTETGQ